MTASTIAARSATSAMLTAAAQMLAILALLLPAATARAQIALPQVTPPTLPDALDRSLGGAVDRGLDDVRGVAALADARARQIRELLRRHRRVLDRDGDGAPVVRGEIVAIDPAPDLLQRLVAAGFAFDGEETLAPLGLRIAVLRAPADLSTRAALALAQRTAPAGRYDYNHLLLRAETEPATATAAAAARASAPTAASAGAAPLRVGLIDSGVERTHPALSGVEIRVWGCEGATADVAAHVDAHGTAVASLLAGGAVAQPSPGAVLYAADVYCGRPTGGATLDVARALAWLSRERVAVINISLVGPRNGVLQRALAAMAARGHLIVAAVGNDGPAAPPLYPAAYPEVVGVAAVDARQRLLPESGRGPQVDFAAPGADMVAAAPNGRWRGVRGTSYAAPIVARLAAQALQQPDAEAAREALARLARAAAPPADGKRDGTGHGVLGAELRRARPPSSSR